MPVIIMLSSNNFKKMIVISCCNTALINLNFVESLNDSWLESAAAGKPLETEAARARVAELWALEQELADEAAILQGLKTDKDAIESLLTGKETF